MALGTGLCKEVGADVCGHRDLHTDAVSRLQSPPQDPLGAAKDCRFFRWDITYNMTHVGTQGPEIGARIALCKQPWRKQSSSLSCLYGSLYIETFKSFHASFFRSLEVSDDSNEPPGLRQCSAGRVATVGQRFRCCHLCCKLFRLGP